MLPVARNSLWSVRGAPLLFAALLIGRAPNAVGQTVDPNLPVTDGQVRAMVRSGNTLFIGGDFSRVGPATGCLVPIDAASAVPLSLPMVAGEVHEVAPDGAGGWYVGGLFSSVAGVPRANLAHVGHAILRPGNDRDRPRQARDRQRRDTRDEHREHVDPAAPRRSQGELSILFGIARFFRICFCATRDGGRICEHSPAVRTRQCEIRHRFGAIGARDARQRTPRSFRQ